MPYTNTIVTTSTGGTWNGTSISYNSISLIDGIPHSAQLEVERVFITPRDTTNYSTIEDFLNNPATTQKDKQQVFIIPASRITFNETSKTITAIDLPNSGATVYDFNPDGDGLADVPVPGIVGGVVGTGDIIKIRRKTVSNQTLVEWSAGSKLTSAQLNLEVKQLIYLIQELIDKTTTEVNVSNTAIGTIPNYSITPTKLSAGGPTWNSSSSLGIGIAPTSRMLTIASPNTSASIQLFNSSTGTGTSDGALIQMSTANLSITNLESGILTLGTNNAGRLSISSDGNISIGATSAAGNTTRYLDIYNYAAGAAASSAMRLITYDATGNLASSAIGQLVKYQTGSFLIQNTDTNAAAHIRFDLGNSEIMRLTSSNRLGLGTDNPSTKLQIAVPSTGTTLTGTSRYGGIHLTQNLTQDEFTGITTSATSSGTQGGILFQGSGTYGTKMHFLTTDAFVNGMQNRMTLNHLGNLGIGGESTGTKLEVITTGTGTNGINIRNSNTGAYGSLHIQGTSGGVGSWANGFVIEGVPYSTGNTIISSYTNSIKFQTGTSRTERMTIGDTGVGIDGLLEVTGNFFCQQSIQTDSIKIMGPASADVNTLDNYTEGTWTPKYVYLKSAAWNDVVATYNTTSTKGTYIRIGKAIFWSCEILISARTDPTGTTQLAIGGFPTGISETNPRPACSINYAAGWTTQVPTGGFYATGASSTPIVILTSHGPTANNIYPTVGNLGTGAHLMANGMYLIP
jgi:hypothetical protein